MKKPNLFIVGMPKTGSTSIHNYLKQHPEIFMSEVKEPNHFCSDIRTEMQEYKKKNNKLTLHNRTAVSYAKLEDYLKLFEDVENEKIIGDASVSNILNKNAMKEIYEFNPTSKIILIIREPVDILQSRYFAARISCYENAESFEEAIRLEKERKKWKKIPNGAIYPSQLYYSEYIKYEKFLKRCLKYFPKERIKVILFDDLKKDSSRVMKEIYEFLNVNPEFKPKIKIHKKTGVMRFKKLYPLKVRTVNLFRKLEKVSPFLSDKIKKIYLMTFIKKERKEIDPEFKKQLMKKYKPEVVKINNLLHKHELIEKDRDLVKLWGYDKI